MDYLEARHLLPLWAFFALTLVLVLSSVKSGVALARRRKTDSAQEISAAIPTVVATTLSLLAFLLAFSFSWAASRMETRRDLLLEEVNAIGTTYLRADLISETHASQVRTLLREYVQTRLDFYMHPDRLASALKKSEDIQKSLWKHAAALASADLKNPAVAALFVESVNQMIDLQTKRVVVGTYRIPVVIWLVFFCLTVFSMLAVGYMFGSTGRANSVVTLVLALSFSIVVFLIADLDRASEGWLRVSNAPMVELQRQLR